jgi:hypothetical protein
MEQITRKELQMDYIQTLYKELNHEKRRKKYAGKEGRELVDLFIRQIQRDIQRKYQSGQAMKK